MLSDNINNFHDLLKKKRLKLFYYEFSVVYTDWYPFRLRGR